MSENNWTNYINYFICIYFKQVIILSADNNNLGNLCDTNCRNTSTGIIKGFFFKKKIYNYNIKKKII